MIILNRNAKAIVGVSGKTSVFMKMPMKYNNSPAESRDRKIKPIEVIFPKKRPNIFSLASTNVRVGVRFPTVIKALLKVNLKRH